MLPAVGVSEYVTYFVKSIVLAVLQLDVLKTLPAVPAFVLTRVKSLNEPPLGWGFVCDAAAPLPGLPGKS